MSKSRPVGHTPGEWHVNYAKPDIWVETGDDEHICTVDSLYEEQQLANADFIVRACNSHAALLAACKLTGDQVIEDMKTSIRAGGKIGLYFSLEELESIQSAIEQAGESGG